MVATRIPQIIFLKMFLWFLMMESKKMLSQTEVTTRTNIKFLKILLLFKLLAMLHLLLMMSGKKLTYCVKTRSLEAHKDDSREC